MIASLDFLNSSAPFTEDNLDFLPSSTSPILLCMLGEIVLSPKTEFLLAGTYVLTVSASWTNHISSCTITIANNNTMSQRQFDLVAVSDEFFYQYVDIDLLCCGNECTCYDITVDICGETYVYPVHVCCPVISCSPWLNDAPIQSIHQNVWQLWSRSYKFKMHVNNFHLPVPNVLRADVQSFQQEGVSRKKRGQNISLELLETPSKQEKLESFSVNLGADSEQSGTHSGTFEMKVEKKIKKSKSVGVHGRIKIHIRVKTAEELEVGSITLILVVTKRSTDNGPRKRRLLTTSQISQHLDLLQQSVQHLLDKSVCPSDMLEVKAGLDKASNSFRCYMRTHEW